MRELTSMEIAEVGGGGFFSRFGAAVLGGIAGMISGGLKGAVTGGQQGGLLGFGIISGGIGVIVEGIFGIIGGALYGFMNDAPQTTKLFNNVMENIFDMNASALK
ncbi:hypothetical protein WK11_16545 [Burkholderia ubonensis]|uniref:Colicin V synthesis protein n=1 Tax=Burkholderia ubonensis TaxID=101571 RepID=A0ABD4DYY6_9BURK|nr:hypothetical protein [Burkholderia ubonensis]KVD44097.1 hypothetical protein WI85_27220 [Burkholderia ubonensis]KVN81587.1 hypothetical protein WJ68_20180 [Burkholderia ubonensis]KVO23968.1 hypothetical protein WJ72_31125 [Burkholderia ubonensis]KVO88899.1 hypothetical protein WJ80_04945 [Burkholderia ubonensis]KVP37901.1 hypothetical protein WJ88_02815 [Burkholderia ubonensis]